MKGLRDKTAIVTGTGSGLGLAIAQRFVDEGMHVLAVDRTPVGDRAAVNGPGTIVHHECDVSDPDAVEVAVRTADERWGRLDVLCNNAGTTSQRALVVDTDVDAWDRVMGVNLRGPFLFMKHSIPIMLRAGGGSVVNIASVGAFISQGMSSPYQSSKGGLVTLTRAAAVEYASRGVRVNAVCPGTIDTPILASLDPDERARYTGLHPMGRLGYAEEIAAMTAFLASDECPFATGACFTVDGGRTAT